MLIKSRDHYTGPFLEIVAAARAAAEAVPPAFPLHATVAVNPYLGQADRPFAETVARLSALAGVRPVPPRAHLLAEWEAGRLAAPDLEEALAREGLALPLADALAALARPTPAPAPIPLVADLAARATGTDWPAIVLDRIGACLAARLDRGQAAWPPLPGRTLWEAWRNWASQDLTPEILGLRGFAARAAALPDEPWAALALSLESLGIGHDAAGPCFEALLLRLGGWSQTLRGLAWDAEREGTRADSLTDLLAIRLAWEEALVDLAPPDAWAASRAALARPLVPSAEDRLDAAFQLAADLAQARRLAATLAAPAPPAPPAPERPVLQAAFCIDVRSEPFRRHLESLDPGIETLGFAGFFGLPLAHRTFGGDEVAPHLPVLLNPALRSAPDIAPEAEGAARIRARAARAWKRFARAAVSSFAYVEAAGPLHLWPLLRDSLRLGAPAAPAGPPPRIEGLDPEAGAATAQAVLAAMGLRRFAPVVLLAGHGAAVTANPQESALHCGACGGRTGETSARALARLLNDPAVRAALSARGVAIPEDTVFVAALHETTTDAVHLLDAPPPGDPRLRPVRAWLEAASRLARAARAPTLPGAGDARALLARARDWAETRPEWGLAGCAAFVAAPRARTRGRDLEGRAFLHSYDWRSDADFATLELILTAPVVVASWIALQYHGSVTAPALFGAGDKALHNVVGGFGVHEGNGGPPRTGLAWQSVHDGERLRHDPLRLTVLVEAPEAAITAILSRHASVRALFDAGWLHLLRLDEAGRVASRYAGGLAWQPWEGAAPAAAA
ncbi:YbcC family protein [Rubellimicrobium sp. CFH 75288]|uniref:YbcC family protein n=1 Tax=Rubellimicrobium sp. CFH 75288 TaxID=2697034 RepID=UPI0014132476|nr:DUF2309 domain-containing protein [Rubellimicrobium sp. CFH 75288]NAZ37562.1 DUF2309 family protein [Rubellimicrobium sp. CFH 75288]